MNFKKTLLTATIALGCMTMSAQAVGEAVEYDFNPYWYGQAQFGVQETLGEASFGDLLAPNAQLGVGYQINPLFGVRLSVNSWQSKASIDYDLHQYSWNWKYVAPMADLTFNLSNFALGYNPKRLCDVNVFAGIGANIAFKNGPANRINCYLSQGLDYNVLRNIWDGTKTRFVGRFGIALDFRLNDALKLGLELNANTLSDNYNSKLAHNADWYFNGLVGLKFNFGKTYKKRTIVVENPAPVVTERIIEKIVEVPAPAPAPEKVIVKEDPKPQTLTRNIFFTISNTSINSMEMQKVAEIANFLKENPNAKVKVTGYADSGTGSLAINLRLAKQRAKAVVDTLVNKYGISASRITADSMTDHEYQPFTEPELNRVAICVASE